MDTLSLSELAQQKIDAAGRTSAGRSSTTVYGGRDHRLRQTLIAMKAGETLAEHESPGEATIHVLTGRLILRTAVERWELGDNEYVPIPDELHAVDAVEDVAFILTVAKALRP